MEHKLTFLDGAMGTMLQRHGLKLGEIPELLAITNPDLLTNIHRQYIEAGTEIVYANTFGANRRKMQKTPYTVADVVSAAIAAAKKACIGTSARVALDIGPLGELLEPMGTLPFETAVDMFAEIVDAGVNAGADLICIETMTDLYEAKAALLAAKEHSTLPVWVTMSFDATGRTFTGCTIPSMARTLEGLGADAIGLNCSQGPKQLLPLFQELCRVTTLPVIAKPNAGLPDPVDGHYDLPPEEFARTMVDVVGAGVSIVGGCCGTNPDYIRALHDAVHTMTPGARDIHHGSFLCTPTMPLEISGVRVIGERINPTGKKRFQQALLAGDLDYIVDVAIAQVDAGAAFRVLSGEDEACAAYVERFGSEAALAAEKQRAATVSSAPTAKAAAAVTNLDDAIIRGLKADAARLAKEALATENELSLVEKHLIPALDKVGTDYERGVAFLPQLLGAAQAAQAVFSVIRDSLAAKGGEPVKKGRIVIATVKGDIHDIGKNIVRTVLENYGYDVLDLGRDVPPETVVDAVVKENIRLVGLSALMTTTLPSMEETVRQLHTLPNPPSIMVGGAVVTPEYAQNMGAFYAKDARASVEIAKKILG